MIRYFDYDHMDGISFHKTADEARSEAEATLEEEADNAADDGWSENVDDICWGVVLGSAERTSCEKSDDGRFDEIVSYAIRDDDDPRVAPAPPLSDARVELGAAVLRRHGNLPATDLARAVLAAADAPTTNPAPVSSSLVVRDFPDGLVRESVRWFAEHMERKLREHDDRPGWIGCDADWLLERMKEERKELTAALRQLAASDGDARTNVLVLRVINEAADVANFAMMIADNARECLPPLPVPAKTGEEEGR
jgi:hypothetical protein